jgi:nanoRNase/pAp phosphatase (c-di-AMP/oligoRNAs hydrolase)
VSKVAVGFGGGGHEWAAGCQMAENLDTVLNKVLQAVEVAMNEQMMEKQV